VTTDELIIVKRVDDICQGFKEEFDYAPKEAK